MRNKFENARQRNMELNNLYNSPKYKPLKYTAIGLMLVVTALFLFMAIKMDHLSVRLLLFLRGCAGALTTIAVVLIAIFYYRVNRDYESNRFNKKRGDDSRE